MNIPHLIALPSTCLSDARIIQIGGPMPTYEVKFELFKSSTKSWQKLCAEAAAFATAKGPDRIINISVSEDHSTGVIVVWYRG